MKKITVGWLDHFFNCDKHEISTYPNSSKPKQSCYEWDFYNNLIIANHPDHGYFLYIKYYNDSGSSETEEICKLKSKEHVIKIWEGLANKKWNRLHTLNS